MPEWSDEQESLADAEDQRPHRALEVTRRKFTGQLAGLWACHHGVRTDFSRPGKPTDNVFNETFNGSLRDECLNLHWLETLAEARAVLEAWRRDTNESRPHMALGHRTPQEYLLLTSPSSEVERSTTGEGSRWTWTTKAKRLTDIEDQRLAIVRAP
jgi:putative transposase